MTRTLASLLAAALFALPAALPATAAAQTPQQPSLPYATLQAGIYLIRAEVAATEPARERGLMFRQSLGANEGMFFLFDAPGAQCMWMRNTLIPLSVAFIADDGTIENIEEMKPQTDDNHCAAKPVRYALEMAGGWFAKRGLKAGSKITKIN